MKPIIRMQLDTIGGHVKESYSMVEFDTDIPDEKFRLPEEKK